MCLTVGLALQSLGCAVDDGDLKRWQTTLGGPKRLVAVVAHEKYPHELRVRAAMSLVEMQPRRGENIGLRLLIDGAQVERKIVPGLAGMSTEARGRLLADLIPLMIEQLRQPPPTAQAGQPLPPDPSFKVKDAAFVMLSNAQTELIADHQLRTQLEDTLVDWAMADFERRLNDRSQAYGMEQLLRLIGSRSVVGLPALMTKDARSLAVMADLVAKLADDKSKEAASQRLVEVITHTASAAWRKEHADELEEANKKAGFEPTDKQFEAQLADYQSEQVIRVFGSMKKVGGHASNDYCLSVAVNKDAPTSQRVAALAALEGNLAKADKAQIEKMLAVAKSDAPPEVLDLGFRRIQELPRKAVVDQLYEVFKTDKWLVRRLAGKTVLAMSKVPNIGEFLTKLDENATKNFNLAEAITYGAYLGDLREGDAKKELAPFFRSGPAVKRVTALNYFYSYGKKADLALLSELKGDTQRVPECKEDGGCQWVCELVVDAKAGKREKKDIKTIGEMVEFCLIPQVQANAEAEKSGSKDEKKSPEGGQKEKP